MKRYNNLWDKICSIDNFRQAYKNAIKGKRKYEEVKAIEKYGPDKYLLELLEEVKENRYTVSKYDVFTKITGGKEREIWKLPMKDRIVQHAIMIHIEPIFRETFIVDTFSSIKGRGIHRALKRIKKSIRKYNYTYYLKLDIKKCYPSLDLNILKQKLAKKFKDKKLLNLLYIIVDSCDKGVPIGNYTSLYFNNFYFNDLDHWLKEQKHIKSYYRYCDDMVILDTEKESLRNIFYEIKERIDKLNVQLKLNYLIYSVDARSVDFLGYKIRKQYTKIRKHIKGNFEHKISIMNLSNLTDKDINILGSYWGILKHADCRHLWRLYTCQETLKEVQKHGRL